MIYMYIFGGPRGIPCGTLGNTKSWECGRTRFFRVTQRSLASPIYTSSKDVTGDFGSNEESKLINEKGTCFGLNLGVKDL